MRKYTLDVGWNTDNRFDTTVERQVVIKAVTNDISYVITPTSGIPATTVVTAPKVLMGAEFTVTVPAGSYLWFAGTGDAYMLVKGPATGVASGTFAPSALKGFGRIKRTADLVCAANVFVSMLRNCVIEDDTGTVVTLDSNGYFVVPTGVEYIRLSTSQFIGDVPVNSYIRIKAVNGMGEDLTMQYSFSASNGGAVTPVTGDIFKVTPGELIGIMIRFSSAYTLRSDLTYTWNVGSYELFGEVSSVVTQGKSNFLGFAEIKRTVNTLFTANVYQEVFRNCAMEGSLGDPGILNPTTGLIAVPAKAKYGVIRLQMHNNGRTSAPAYVKLTKNGASISNLTEYSTSVGVTESFAFNCEGLTSVGIAVYMATSNYTAQIANTTGSIEFYTAEQSENIVLPDPSVNNRGATAYWNGCIRRANAAQAGGAGERQINLPNITKVSPGFSAAQTVSNGIVIPPGVKFVNVKVHGRLITTGGAGAAIWANIVRSGSILKKYLGIQNGVSVTHYLSGVASVVEVLPGDIITLNGVFNSATSLTGEHDDACWLEVEAVVDSTDIPVPETPILMGIANLKRTSNVLLGRLSAGATNLLTGCVYSNTTGSVGSINSFTGVISVPLGCKTIEFNFGFVIPGYNGVTAYYEIKNDSTGTILIQASAGTTGILFGGSASCDVEGATDIRLVFIHNGTTAYTATPNGMQMATVKFYR